MKLNLRQHGSIGLIALVFLITFYQIFPTLIYNTRPLDQPLSQAQAQKFYDYQVHQFTEKRELQKQWLASLCKNLKLNPRISDVENQPQLLALKFTQAEAKTTFENFLPAATQLSSRMLGHLQLVPSSDPLTALVATGMSWSESDLLQLPCDYTSTSHNTSTAFQEARKNWLVEVLQALQADPQVRGTSNIIVQALNTDTEQWNNSIVSEILRICGHSLQGSGLGNSFEARKLAFLLQGEGQLSTAIDRLSSKMQAYIKRLEGQSDDESTKIKNGLQAAIQWMARARSEIKKNETIFSIKQLKDYVNSQNLDQEIQLPFIHPLVSTLKLSSDPSYQLQLRLHEDLLVILKKEPANEQDSRSLEMLTSKLYDLMAYLQQADLGQGMSNFEGCALTLDANHHLYWLICNLQPLNDREEEYLQRLIELWKPSSPQLQAAQFKILNATTYQDPTTPLEDKLFCLVLDPKGIIPIQAQTAMDFPKIIFKGMDLILQMTQQSDQSTQKAMQADLECLDGLLSSRGYRFFGTYGLDDKQWHGSGIFINVSPYQQLIEGLPNWRVIGNSSTAFFPVENYANWAKQLNQAEEESHKELVRWHEDWRLASSDMNPLRQALAVKPPKNLFWNNFKLSWRKILRGDAKRVLKWGLDLSGGRTVRLAIYDANHHRITDPNLLIQARNELIQRVNRMGLSEVAARIEGEHLVMDFPSSQGYSSKELIQATTMSFHLVNERFCSPVSPIRNEVEEFLSHVWSEALITHRTDSKSLNDIARRLLQDAKESNSVEAKLIAAGLKIAPEGYNASNSFSEEYSMIVRTKEDSRSHATNGRHPLLIVMRNWALQGSDLSDVRSGYDPQHGNILTFEVKNSNSQGDRPQEAFWRWTSHFSAEQIAGTGLEAFTGGKGWRMAVILNDEVVSSPALSSGLKDRAMIYGQFSPRDVAKLAAELKAGSLSFSPQILSEENISPELGRQDRQQGMMASLLALLAVIACMISYYRFGGLIASVAVILNLLIVWAVMQNLGAALTLPGLAGLVLTMGMAVDANVLVFERIREEISSKQSLIKAIQAGYSRAFSAIVDSNLTTILAALILVQFDSGPIKGFAITLIIGITSSMFTALFMTRVFFERWANSNPNAQLTMANWIGKPSIPFLEWSKPFIIGCLVMSAAGCGLLWHARHQILGMDFIGGYAFTISLDQSLENPKNYMVQVLESAGLSRQSFDVRELGTSGRLKVYLSRSLDQPGSVFYNMKEDSERLQWIEGSLKNKLSINDTQKNQIHDSWNSVSGQLSQSMRIQAILGLLLALVGILIYLAVRFEWLFAAAGVLSLSFDVLTSFAAIGWLRWMGLPMQIDLQAVGAIMTIVGYALNDKIIVFDRIREERQKGSLRESLVQQALRSTLSRTLMTSGTTLIVLLVLDILGGSSLLSFSMIMTIGVIVGTLSSLFAAPAILLGLAKRLGHSD